MPRDAIQRSQYGIGWEVSERSGRERENATSLRFGVRSGLRFLFFRGISILGLFRDAFILVTLKCIIYYT